MMFVGYADHERDRVRMWDLVTSWVIMTGDVFWLKKMFFKHDSPDVIELDTLANLKNDKTPTEANNQPNPDLTPGQGGILTTMEKELL